MGFGVPLKHWFRKDAAEFTREVLLGRATRERGIFNPRQLEWILARHAEGRRDFSGKIWTLLFFELWCRHWLDAAATDSAQSAIAACRA
jgi:asparagine synthase (glutamine-hydrolysing)